MHRTMNRSFQESLPETKWSYIEQRNHGVLRKVALFVQGIHNSKGVQDAIADYIKNDMKAIY